MKKRILTIAALLSLTIGIAEAKIFIYWVTGSGTAQENDRSAAVSEATDTATQQANAICTGEVGTVETTGTSCFGGGDNNPYTCLVFVKAECRVHTAR